MNNLRVKVKNVNDGVLSRCTKLGRRAVIGPGAKVEEDTKENFVYRLVPKRDCEIYPQKKSCSRTIQSKNLFVNLFFILFALNRAGFPIR